MIITRDDAEEFCRVINLVRDSDNITNEGVVIACNALNSFNLCSNAFSFNSFFGKDEKDRKFIEVV